MKAEFTIGDSLAVLQQMPGESVDLVLTSPPFFSHRSYLPENSEEKANELGLEKSVGEYVDNLLDVVEECQRVLAPHGSLCIELGDTYAGKNGPSGNPLAKSLMLVPETVRFSLTYGHNPITGRETPRWRTRNVVTWARPNPPVGRLSDKFRPGTSDMLIVCKSRDRYFDLEAVREPAEAPVAAQSDAQEGLFEVEAPAASTTKLPRSGSPPLDWWVVNPSAYRGAHDAVWPVALLDKPIASMVPHHVCTECGDPSRRIVEAQRTLDGEPVEKPGAMSTTRRGGADADGIGHSRRGTTYTTLGWTDCGHDSWRPGVVLDPYAGTGTTLLGALAHGVKGIGIDLDQRNADEARDRLGMFVEVVDRSNLRRQSVTRTRHKGAQPKFAPLVPSPLSPALNEIDRLFASGSRYCLQVFEQMATPNGVVPSLVFEDNPGYYPLIGSPGQAPWYWGNDISKARAIAVDENAKLGLNKADVLEIVASSMLAGIREDDALAKAHNHFESVMRGQALEL